MQIREFHSSLGEILAALSSNAFCMNQSVAPGAQTSRSLPIRNPKFILSALRASPLALSPKLFANPQFLTFAPLKRLTASTAKNRLCAHLASSICDSQPSYRKGACPMNRKYRALLIGTLSLLLIALVSSCQPSPPANTNAANTNASSPTASATASPNASPGATPNAGKTGTSGPPCDDPPPANPANCTPPINQPFFVGCNLPFAVGPSHDIDQHCPNEGCATRDRDKAQNTIKNNLCSVGPAIQISTTSIDKLQAAVDQLVAQQTFTYGQSPPQPADRATLHDLSTVTANGNAVLLGEGKLVTFEGFVLDAKHDDTYLQGSGPQGFKGEGVNCKTALLEWKDS